MSEMLLLGAGASVSADVPGAYDMTKRMLELFQRNPSFKVHSRVLSFVIGGLQFQIGKRGGNPLTHGVNIEDLFNAVQLLSQRHELEAAPFVGSWDDMVEELDRLQPSTSDLDQAIYRSVAGRISRALSKLPSRSNIDNAYERGLKKICESAVKGRSPSLFSSDRVGHAVEEYVKSVAEGWRKELSSTFGIGNSAGTAIERSLEARIGRGEGHIYEEVNELMVAVLKDLVWISQDRKLEYLGPILNLAERQGRLVIATLNYDNAIESLCASQGDTCRTGIDEWTKSGNFECEGDGVHLLKLHGSIDWQKTGDGKTANLADAMPQAGIRQVSLEEVSKPSFMPAVIFGQRNKLTAEGPFLDLLRAFRSGLSKSRTLTVIGYSFRDAHVNVFISQWLNKAPENKLRIINGPNFGTDASEYVSLILNLRQRFPNKVEIISEYAKEGLLQVYGTYAGEFGTNSTTPLSAVEAAVSSTQAVVAQSASPDLDVAGAANESGSEGLDTHD